MLGPLSCGNVRPLLDPYKLKLISCCNCFQIRVRARNDSKPSVQVDFWVWYSLVAAGIQFYIMQLISIRVDESRDGHFRIICQNARSSPWSKCVGYKL